MTDDLEARMADLENRLSQLKGLIVYVQQLQIAMLGTLDHHLKGFGDTAPEVAERMRDRARAEDRLEDARALDALIYQFDQALGLPAND